MGKHPVSAALALAPLFIGPFEPSEAKPFEVVAGIQVISFYYGLDAVNGALSTTVLILPVFLSYYASKGPLSH